MALVDLWNSSPDQLRDKQVQQIIVFAGSGKLRDGGEASQEFCDFLAVVPSRFLSRYVDECLTGKFEDSGLALQDVVNEIGRRLGFEVVRGVYRGSAGKPGHDGIWKTEDGKSIVVEVKTTDAYRIDLDTVAGYRRALIQEGILGDADSSILIVVGRQDTGDLEAQSRGSRHAWDARLISSDSLIRLMKLKEEELEEPPVLRKIRNILTPQEFTRVDDIIDLVFDTATEVKEGEVAPAEADIAHEVPGPELARADFNEACIERIQAVLGRSLIRRSRTTYVSADKLLTVVCAVSRAHGSDDAPSFWYGFHPHQEESLHATETGYVAFGCGSEQTVLLIPKRDFHAWLEGMNVTERADRMFWHVHIIREADRFFLRLKTGFDDIELTRYLLASSA